jgi:hypothetical protein
MALKSVLSKLVRETRCLVLRSAAAYVLVVGGEQLFRSLLNLGLVARIPPIGAATDPQHC